MEDAAHPDPILSGSLGEVCALCLKTACLLEGSKRYTAIHYADPLCPLSDLWSADVVSVTYFAVNGGDRCCSSHRRSTWSLCLRVQCFKKFRWRPLPLQICHLLA